MQNMPQTGSHNELWLVYFFEMQSMPEWATPFDENSMLVAPVSSWREEHVW